MDAMAVSQRLELSWDDFAWIDQPTPTLSDVVKEPSANPVLTMVSEGRLISDRNFLPDQALHTVQMVYCVLSLV